MNGTTRVISSSMSTGPPGPALTPPTSTTSAPPSHPPAGRRLGGLIGEGCAAVVERVRCPVHDRHDQRSIAGHRAAAEGGQHAIQATGARFRCAQSRYARPITPNSLLGLLAGLRLVRVLVVERHVALVAAGQHIDRVVADVVPLLAQVDLLALEG